MSTEHAQQCKRSARLSLGSAMPQRALMSASVLVLGRVLPPTTAESHVGGGERKRVDLAQVRLALVEAEQRTRRQMEHQLHRGVLEWTAALWHAAGLDRLAQCATAAEG